MLACWGMLLAKMRRLKSKIIVLHLTQKFKQMLRQSCGLQMEIFNLEKRVAELQASNEELRRNVVRLNDFITEQLPCAADTQKRTVTIKNTFGEDIRTLEIPKLMSSGLLLDWLANRLCLDATALHLSIFSHDSWAEEVLDATQIILSADWKRRSSSIIQSAFAREPIFLKSPARFLSVANIAVLISGYLSLKDLFALAATSQEVFFTLIFRGGPATWINRIRSLCPPLQCFSQRPVIEIGHCVSVKDRLHSLDNPSMHPDDVIKLSMLAQHYSQEVEESIMFPHSRIPVVTNKIEFETLQCGSWLDVLDTVNKWYDATVLQIDNTKRTVKVHYNNWSNNWDEDISFDTARQRFAPLGEKFDREVDTLKSAVRYFALSNSGAAFTRESITELLRNTFHDIDEINAALIDNSPSKLSQAGDREFLSMVETCFIRPSALQEIINRSTVKLLLEFEYFGKCCAFFFLSDDQGRGVVYTRYGSHRWKH